MAKLLVGSTVNGNLIWHDGGTSDREMTMVYQNISQSITTGAFTQMTFDTVKFDNLGTWVSSNNSMTIKKGGIYLHPPGIDHWTKPGSRLDLIPG